MYSQDLVADILLCCCLQSSDDFATLNNIGLLSSDDLHPLEMDFDADDDEYQLGLLHGLPHNVKGCLMEAARMYLSTSNLMN